MFTFDGANALVVGAAGGIGRALAIEFSRRGSRVAAADLDAAGAAATAAEIDSSGGCATSVGCDVTDAASLSAAVAAAEAFLGDLDIAANTAGVLLSGNPEDIPVQEWQRIFAVNLFGAVRLNELVLPKMLARGSGYIVNTASVAGLYPFAVTRVPYAASKAALILMSENLAISLRPRGVRVSCLCPGPTATPIGGRSREWTEGLKVVGPGRDYTLQSAPRAAQVFCDGMAAGRVIISSEEAVSSQYVQRHAASPDDFILERIGQYACGDYGLPQIDFADPEIMAALHDLQGGR